MSVESFPFLSFFAILTPPPHQYIDQLNANHNIDDWLRTVITQIENLKFAIDWSTKHPDNNSSLKSQKSASLKSLFTQQPAVKSRLQNASSPDNLWKAVLAAEFKTWKRKNEVVITARNRLLRLYDLVIFFFPLSFY